MSSEHGHSEPKENISLLTMMTRMAFGNPKVIRLTDEVSPEELSIIKHKMATQFGEKSDGYADATQGSNETNKQKDLSREKFIDPRTLELFENLIRPGDTVLDLAAGALPYAQAMLGFGASQIIAVDTSEDLLKSGVRALSSEQQKHITLIAANMTEPINFMDFGLAGKADVAVSTLAQLYALDDQFGQVCRNITEALNDKGVFCMTVPNIEAAKLLLGEVDDNSTYIVEDMGMKYAGTEIKTTFAARSVKRYADLAGQEGLELVNVVPLEPDRSFYLNVRTVADLLVGLGYAFGGAPHSALFFKRK